MNNINIFVGAAVLAMISAAPATAKEQCFDKGTLSYTECPSEPDVDIEPDADYSSVDFSGFYVGAHAGYAGADFDGQFDVSDGFNSPILSSSDGSGMFGFFAGYRHQYDNDVVVGVEVDASFVDLGASASADAIAGSSEVVSGSVDFLASARLRLGYAMDDFLPYVTAGVGLVSYEYEFQDQSTHVTNAGKPDRVKREETAIAGVFGGGLEYRVDEDISLRVEGLYYAVDDEIGLPAQVIDDADNGDFGGVGDIWTVRVGISYEF